MLLPRILTAIVGIPVLLWLIHRGGLAFSLFVVGVAALSLYEYGLILAVGGRPAQRVNAVLVGTALAAAQVFDGPLGLVLAAGIALTTLTEMAAPDRRIERPALTLFGAFLLGWMPAHLAAIRDLRPYGEQLTFLLFAGIWVMDTAAYAAGKTLGRRKLAPELSPKKTWEGFIAGWLAVLGAVFAFRHFWPDALTVPQAVALGVALGAGGQISDLAESMIKRAVGAKDSGTLLPGHGGVMDRFDSFLLGAPAAYYCLKLL